MNHFENLFRAPAQASIAEVIRVAQMFPRFAEEEDNRRLMRHVDEEELKEVLGSFQKIRAQGRMGGKLNSFRVFMRY